MFGKKGCSTFNKTLLFSILAATKDSNNFYHLLRVSFIPALINSMDRSKRKDYEWLKERGTTAYECLGIDKLASFEIIKKAYRRKALLLHPDKNLDSSSDELFKAVNVSYQILSDPESKRIYDEELSKPISNVADDAKISKFKSDLQHREKSFQDMKDSETRRKFKIEKLSKWYDDYVKGLNINSSNPTNTTKSNIFPKLVQLKWKNNPSVPFDEELINKLISVFAIPKSVQLSKQNKPNDRYHYATIEFNSPIPAAILAKHDFSITQDYWDTLNLRKTASLLRGAKLIGFDKINKESIDYSTLPHSDYIAFSFIDFQI